MTDEMRENDSNVINDSIGEITDEKPTEPQAIPEQGMKEEKTGLVDNSGEEVKKISIPVVKFRDFVFPITTVTPEYQNYVGSEGGVRPIDIVREVRMTLDEMRNKFTVLSVGLAVIAETNPDVKDYLNEIGLVLEDLNKKRFFPAE